MLSLVQGADMDYTRNSNLGPTLGSDPESLEFWAASGIVAADFGPLGFRACICGPYRWVYICTYTWLESLHAFPHEA